MCYNNDQDDGNVEDWTGKRVMVSRIGRTSIMSEGAKKTYWFPRSSFWPLDVHSRRIGVGFLSSKFDIS